MEIKNLEGKIWPLTTQIGGGIGIIVSAAKFGYEAITGDPSIHALSSYINPVIHSAGLGYCIGSAIDTAKYVSNKVKDIIEKKR
jgi:hypothetical protein